MVNCIPQNEMVVLAGDKNEHDGSSNVGYDGRMNDDQDRCEWVNVS